MDGFGVVQMVLPVSTDTLYHLDSSLKKYIIGFISELFKFALSFSPNYFAYLSNLGPQKRRKRRKYIVRRVD